MPAIQPMTSIHSGASMKTAAAIGATPAAILRQKMNDACCGVITSILIFAMLSGCVGSRKDCQTMTVEHAITVTATCVPHEANLRTGTSR